MTPLVTKKGKEATILIAVLCLICLTFAVGYGVCRAAKYFSSPSPQSGAVSNTAVPDTLIPRFYTTLEQQRIMRDEGLYTGPIDGLDGPLTQAARVKHDRLYNDQQAAKDLLKRLEEL